ncbi:MAG: cyclic nucleotide-binding domain-containing protein, partial [Deltaproteobacteria bacterium]|nr:cyclic nucleotide-binding domain-containing protein [Deltaproteobacteria bacterium]
MKIMITALIWGCISAISLPLGAIIGLWSSPSRKITSALMAFGGGALLFALTIELFAHSLHRSHEGHDIRIILATMIGAILGGLLFTFLNQFLNNRGAFLRKASLIQKHILKTKRGRARKMIRALSKIKLLQVLPADEVAQLIPHVKTVRFPAGETIFRQGDMASELYFIVEGCVQVIRGLEADTKLIAELGEGDTFGEIALISDQPRTATVRAITDIEVCTIHKGEFEHLIKQSSALRDAISRMVKDMLHDIQEKDSTLVGEAEVWEESAQRNLDRLSIPVTENDLNQELE